MDAPYWNPAPYCNSFTGMGPFTEKDGSLYGAKSLGPLWEAPYGEGRSLREGPVLTGSVGVLYRAGSLHIEGRRRGLTGTPLTGRLLTGRPLTGRLLTGDTFNYRKAYGKAGPLRETPYEEGRSLREGPVIIAGSFTGLGPFTEKDDEEAYEKAGPLQAGGTVLTGRGGSLALGPFTEKDDEEAYGRLGPYGKPLTGRNGPYGKGRSLREGPGSFTGLGPFTENNDL